MSSTQEIAPRADAAAVLTCFVIPGLIAGGLSGAVVYGEGPGVWPAAARGAVVGALGAGLLGGVLALALRGGIESSTQA